MMVNDSLLSGQFIKLYLPKIVLMMKWLLLWDLGRLSWLSEQGGALGPSPGEIATTGFSGWWCALGCNRDVSQVSFYWIPLLRHFCF